MANIEEVKPYGKHNIYWGIYTPKEDTVKLPSKAEWKVLKYVGFETGSGIFSNNLEEKGVIALILADEENRFFPVISFLTREEAESLIRQLKKAVGGEE